MRVAPCASIATFLQKQPDDEMNRNQWGFNKVQRSSRIPKLKRWYELSRHRLMFSSKTCPYKELNIMPPNWPIPSLRTQLNADAAIVA